MSKLLFHQAIKSNDIDTVLDMCDRYPDIASEYDLEYICKQGHLEMARLFYSKHANMCRSVVAKSMKMVCMKGYVDVVEWLLTVNQDRDVVHDCINTSCKSGQIDVLKHLCEYVMRDSDFAGDIYQFRSHSNMKHTKTYMLLLAGSRKNIDIVKYILYRFPEVETCTAFAEACWYNALEIAECLANHRALRYPDILSACKKAVKQGHIHVLEWLIQNNNDLVAKHANAIFDTACGGKLEMVQWFASKYPVILEEKHPNAFDKACKHNRLEILEWLLANVDVNGDFQNVNKNFDHACVEGWLPIAQCIANMYPQDDISEVFYRTCATRHIHVVQWLSTNLDIDINRAFQQSCKSDYDTMARFLLKTYPMIDIHADSETAFLTASRTANLHIIRLFTEYSDEIASYHMLQDEMYYSYMITKLEMECPEFMSHITHEDLEIYGRLCECENTVIEDVKRVLGLSKKKSAHS